MSDLAVLPVAGVVGDDLTARTVRVARQVADVVARTCSPESGAPQAVAFLRDWADAAAPAPVRSGEPLDRLATRFGLSEAELDLLVLAGLPEEHEGLASTFRSLHPLAEPRPTVGLAALLRGGTPAERAALRDLLSAGAAVRAGLLRLGGGVPFFERSLLTADALWAALHGSDAWPETLPRTVLAPPPPGMGPWLERPDVQACVAAVRRGVRALLVVPHENRAIGRARCAAIAAAAGVPIVGASLGPADTEGIALLLAHAAARGAVPFIEPGDADRPAASLALGDYPGPVMVSAAPGAVVPPADRAVLAVDAGPVPTAAVRAGWHAALPGIDGRLRDLAARHPLDPTVTAQLSLDLAVAGRDPDPAHVAEVVRTRTGVNLPAGARLLTPHVHWSDLVLPPDALAQLHAAVARLEQQATVLEDWGLAEHAQATRGVRLLFSGPPGTGKSLAAAVLATAARTDLMVVDVSRLVSKWLGETEKNLAATFEAAERTRSVLLLDEADALFGTRTEISDAHDRYANLETAYLLQRIEQFDGLVVLTSNLRQNIDPAFTRRLDFVVDFPLPDLAARVALWRRCLPAPSLGAVLAPDLDLDGLARLYPVPGGWIRNAAVAAAFDAAGSGEPITGRRLVDAVRREYLKASTPFPGEPPRRRDDHD
ncbi:MAG: AAA family ATPase [Propionicimonas sp.]|uniref:ATP-binding protein n=1 Tax=Propionicimonas sp. TaxID=1955623 RepID=UPI003D10901D